MPRYLPVQPDAANENIQQVYAEVERDIGFVPNYIKTLAHSAPYLKPLADAYRAVLTDGGLSDKVKVLVGLKTCRQDKCKVTVDHFAQLATEVGWTQDQIDALDDYAASDLFDFYERDLLRLVEEVLAAPDDISQNQFWETLDNHFTSDQVIETIALIGFLNMINRFVLAIEIAPDEIPVPS